MAPSRGAAGDPRQGASPRPGLALAPPERLRRSCPHAAALQPWEPAGATPTPGGDVKARHGSCNYGEVLGRAIIPAVPLRGTAPAVPPVPWDGKTTSRSSAAASRHISGTVPAASRGEHAGGSGSPWSALYPRGKSEAGRHREVRLAAVLQGRPGSSARGSFSRGQQLRSWIPERLYCAEPGLALTPGIPKTRGQGMERRPERCHRERGTRAAEEFGRWRLR